MKLKLLCFHLYISSLTCNLLLKHMQCYFDLFITSTRNGIPVFVIKLKPLCLLYPSRSSLLLHCLRYVTYAVLFPSIFLFFILLTFFLPSSPLWIKGPLRFRLISASAMTRWGLNLHSLSSMGLVKVVMLFWTKIVTSVFVSTLFTSPQPPRAFWISNGDGKITQWWTTREPSVAIVWISVLLTPGMKAIFGLAW